MRIDEIKIINYRQYRDETFIFPQNGKCDLHIIIGQNTLGKTNFLNAIAWCLFFEEPHLGIKYKAQPVVNLKTLSEAQIGTLITVKVSIKVSFDDCTLTFSREVGYKKEDTTIQIISNNFDAIYTIEEGVASWKVNDEAVRLLNKFFPHGLQEFFFFDGEQLDGYFISDKRTRIETPIYEISQVGLLNKIIEHLDAVINEFKREASKGHPDLAELFSKQETCKGKKEEIETTIFNCGSQLAISEEIIARRTEFLRGQEDVGELESKKNEILHSYNSTKTIINDRKGELKDFIREYTIKISLYPAIVNAINVISKKEENGELPPNIDRNLLLKAIEEKKCSICKCDLDDVHIENINRILENISISTEVSHILTKIKGPLERIIIDIKNYPNKRDELLTSLGKLEKELANLDNQLNDVENRLSNCSNKDEIRNALNERKQHERLRIENIQKMAINSERLKCADQDLEIVTKDYENALRKSGDHDELIQNKQFSENALNLACQIKNELMNEMREKIRTRMQELFLKFTWRENTYKEVILADDYTMGLIHKDGYECLGSISAAERALLALSFTLALHEVSGFDSPLVIDTPVARISDINRGKFAEVLKEISQKKQLILLFTPSEYSQEISSYFDGCNSTKYSLFSEDERISHIRI
ncbi:MAG: AAA family ATPase [Anaerolineaceae bacterium]|nr:AAA family ATPase [Anaerolineaceae bacterium]